MSTTEFITRQQFKDLFDKHMEKSMKEANTEINDKNKLVYEHSYYRTLCEFFLTDKQQTEVMEIYKMIKREYQVIEFTEADAITGRMVLSTDTKYGADLFAEQYAAEMGTTVKVVEKLIFL